MERILSDSVNRAHDCVVGKFAFLASIVNKGTLRRAKMVEKFSQRLAIRQNDIDGLSVSLTPLHKDAPHPVQCFCGKPGACAQAD